MLENLTAALQESKGVIIAIDGKTPRGTRGWYEKDRPLHLLHAWSTEQGVCLGQVSVDEKSNEIAALPEPIESFLKKLLLMVSHLQCQKNRG